MRLTLDNKRLGNQLTIKIQRQEDSVGACYSSTERPRGDVVIKTQSGVLNFFNVSTHSPFKIKLCTHVIFPTVKINQIHKAYWKQSEKSKA